MATCHINLCKLPLLFTIITTFILNYSLCCPFFSMCFRKLESFLAYPGWVIQAQYCSLVPALVSVNPYHDQSHKGEGSWVHSQIPRSPIADFKRSTALNWSWPLRSSKVAHPPHWARYTTVFICQWEGLWPNESPWHPPKTHNDFWGDIDGIIWVNH